MGKLYAEMAGSVEPAIAELAQHGFTQALLDGEIADLHAALQTTDQVTAFQDRLAKQPKDAAALGPHLETFRRLDPEALDLRRNLRKITVTLGRALKGTTEASIQRYHQVQPSRFGKDLAPLPLHVPVIRRVLVRPKKG